MKSRKPMLVRMLDAVQGRFRRARPGSVLIMVVSLLVLLALIGTAAISTSRLDRTSSLQNVKNVQVDLIAEGVKQMVLGVLTKDANGNTSDSTVLSPDAPVVDEANAILASLLPERRLMRNPKTGEPYFRAASPALPDKTTLGFQSVSYPPVQTGFERLLAGGVHIGPYKFDVPTENSADDVFYGLPEPKPAMVPVVYQAPDKSLYPGLVAVGADGNAMTQFPPRNGPAGINSRLGQPFLAADTDGDGVADAMLVKLPITPINGITYYAAVRVVDNAAKINLNTAGNANNETAQVQIRNAGTLTNATLSFAGIYPASVSLETLFDPSNPPDSTEGNLTEDDKFNGQRIYGSRLWGPGALTPANVLTPYNYNGTARNDFVFLTPGDALHNQLGRRLDNPSISGANSKAGGQPWLYGGGTRPFGISDAMALAYRFTLINPVAYDSTIEKTLFMTTLTARDDTGKLKPGMINKPYALSTAGITAWFDDNFDYRWLSNTPPDQSKWSAAKTQLLRSLLTTFNPVTTTTPTSNVAQDLYRFRYIVEYDKVAPGFRMGNPPPAAGTPPDTYVAPAIPDPNLPGGAEQQPLVASAQKVPNVYSGKANVNTAQFEELWRRYFDVMCETATTTPFDGGAYDDIYQGCSFNHISPFGNVLAENAGRMFRSPLRPEIPAPPAPSNGIARMHPYQVMALRAAIAAANTIAMRTDFDPPGSTTIYDRNIPFFDIILPQVDKNNDHKTYTSAPGTTNFYGGMGATVYGVKRQPFITEVFLDNNTETIPVPTTNPDGTPGAPKNLQNQSGFAAIEIHNPYDRPMRISGWKLVLVDRHLTNDGGVTGVDWQNQTDAAGDKRPPRLRTVDLPDNTAASGWNPDKPYATAYTPFTFSPTAVIPAHGFLVVTNLLPTGATAGAGDTDTAAYAPPNTKVDALRPGVPVEYCKMLHWMMNREVQLVRPVDRRLTDTGGADKGFWAVRWAPVDSFDATGIVHNVAGATALTSADEWHYVRSNDPTNGAGSRAWHFVYPGRFEAIAGAAPQPHHQGVETKNWNPQGGALSLWEQSGPTAAEAPILFGALDAHNSRDTMRDNPAMGWNPATPTNPVVSTFPIQIANSDFATQFNRTGPTAPMGAAFPLNGFTRLGDIMQVTYIGSYTVWDADANWTQTLSAPFTSGTVNGAQKWEKQTPGFGGDLDTYQPDGTKSGKPAPVLPYPMGAGGEFIEINPVTMDAAAAEDTDFTDDYLPGSGSVPTLGLEDIGRFTPIYFDRGSYPGTPLADLNAYKYEDGQIINQAVSDKFQPAGNWLQSLYPKDFWVGYECVIYNLDVNTQNVWKMQVRRVTQWDGSTITLESPLKYPLANPGFYKFKLQRMRYDWSRKLLDYFTTTNAPGDDYLPNTDPFVWTTAPVEPAKNVSDPSQAVNRTKLPTEDGVPAEGLININTANWKTLAQLPLVMSAGNPLVVDQAATEAVAREIVYFRDVDDGRGVDPTTLTPAPPPPHPHGAFKSLHELLMVPFFMTAYGNMDTTGSVNNNPGVLFGDYSPMTAPPGAPAPSGDLVRWDFKEKYLMLTRISNLVTTKSDSFTAYIQVQGWRDAGTADAKLAVQKRLSFIIDRSKVTTSAKATPTVYNVPVAE